MKKVDEMIQELTAMKEQVRSLLNENKVDDADVKMAEVRSLEKKIELQKEIDADEAREVEEKMTKANTEVRNDNKEVEYRAIAKHLAGKELTAEERASMNVGNSGAVMPQGFVATVETLTKGFPSLKQHTHVIGVSTNTGKMPISSGSATRKLAKLATDTEMVKEMVTTNPVEYAVEDFGKIYPVENSVLEDAGVDLFNGLIAPDVAECAVNSQNDEILEIVKANAVAGATGSDYKAIIKTLNTKVVPSLLGRTVIVTNQDGYDYLDGLEDNNGRPLLTDNLAVEGGKLFKGRPVVVLDNADLPNSADATPKKPFYVVNLYALVKFFDRKQYEIATSKEAGFTYNQTFVRVVERFDVVKGDARACFIVQI
ncbi:phage major capsid protein [Paenibacillus sp. NPDC093718]|uniref:phage major capsid protein n=1 Tax=Paenibacillus sp. NPDC093718 TaxID=3390601 RepID=UPI003CFE2D61